MNIDEYKRSGLTRYEKFAEIISKLIEHAISVESGYRLQHIQHRAKTIGSLTKRLEEIEQSDSDEIEKHRKDLAGCRVVFYTNNDFNKFTNSGLLRELFDIDWSRSRFHQPNQGETSANKLFQSYNYVLKLKSDRATLLEYREFDGLYCEVQVQTSLNHVWSEMGHDIIYKYKKTKGFGTKEIESIEKRLEDVMNNHLTPAGYIFQQIASDVQRLAEGKALFDADILNETLTAKDNNERFEALDKLQNLLLHYDDLPTIFPKIREKLKEAWILAGKTQTVPHETPSGNYPGHESSRVTARIADIIEQYRYIDINETYIFIRDLYIQTSDSKSRDQLIKIAEHLAIHTLQIWERDGAFVQVELAKMLSNEKDISPFAPIAIAIASKILEPEISGTTSSSSAMTFHRGAIVYSKPLEKARKTVIKIVAAYAKTVVADDEALRSVLNCLFTAGRRIYNGNESPEAIAMILRNLTYSIEQITTFIDATSFNSRQNIESHLLQEWRWNKSLRKNLTEIPDIVDANKLLLGKIKTLRDKLSADEEFVIFKTIVGYRSVFSHMWDNRKIDIKRDETIRHEAQKKFVDSVTKENWNLWKKRLSTAANLKSNDGATFPPLSQFLSILANHQPDFALDLLSKAETMPDWAIRPIASELLEGNKRKDIETLLSSWVQSGKFIDIIAELSAFSENVGIELILKATARAIKDTNEEACVSFIEAAIRQFAKNPTFWRDQVFFPCLAALKQENIYYWISRSLHKVDEKSLFSNLTSEQSKTVLDAILGLKKIDYQAERILKSIATKYHQIVLDWFGQRIEHATQKSSINYEPIPFSFHSVHKALQPYPHDVMASVKQWHDHKKGIGAWRVASFLKRIYPNFEEPLASAINGMVQNGNEDDLTFIASSLQGYKGLEDLLPILRDILASKAINKDIESNISYIFNETGVTRGKFGVAQAYQAKADLLKPWLNDKNQRVKDFATREIKSLDLQVASETRRAKEEGAMRKLQYGEDLNE